MSIQVPFNISIGLSMDIFTENIVRCRQFSDPSADPSD